MGTQPDSYHFWGSIEALLYDNPATNSQWLGYLVVKNSLPYMCPNYRDADEKVTWDLVSKWREMIDWAKWMITGWDHPSLCGREDLSPLIDFVLQFLLENMALQPRGFILPPTAAR
jgi:hypothetical protein